MRQNAKKFGLTLAALILAVLLVGTAVLAPCLVSAEDGEGGRLIDDPSDLRMEGPGEREPVAPSFGSPGAGDILFEQPPYDPSSPYFYFICSDVYYEERCFEDFWGLTEDIGDIHWYGLTVDPYYYYPCDPTGMEFEIIFYEDSGGYPGAPVAVFSNVIPSITYYDTFSGFPAYLFEVADLGTPVSLTEGWVSIQATYCPNACIFYWLNSPAGNWNARWEYYGYLYPTYDNLAFALTEAQPPPPPNVKYLHAEGGWMNITDPLDTQWHELWPVFSRQYHLSGWEDNGDGVLSYCDTVNMYEKPDGELRPYHVENVTITLLVTNNVTGESKYIELEGGFNSSVLTYPPGPVGSQWHEIYPEFCGTYNLTDWTPTGNPTTELDPCDYILLEGDGVSPVRCPLDEWFSWSFPPSGWTNDDWCWFLADLSGGTPPEAWLSTYFCSFYDGYAYLQSKWVDTTAVPCLTLEFKSYIDDYCYNGSYNCTVYTRADGGDEWTDVTPWSNPIYSNVGPGTYQVDISSDIGSGTQVRFEFDGIENCLLLWTVDDVKICYPDWWHVEDVAVDIVVTPEPPPVGGEAYPVSKASLLAPWIAMGVAVIVGAGVFVLRRRRA